MRRSKEATAETRQRILEEAARLFREKGIAGVGVAEVMEAASLTHGGFYRHFPSKEALVAEAVGLAFDDRVGPLERPGDAEGAARAYVDSYLSPGHLAHPGEGCPIAALGAEAGQGGPALTEVFAAGVERLVAALAAGLPGPPEESRPAALRLLSSLVGAVVLARATGRPALQDEVLRAVRETPAIRALLD